MKKTLIIFNIVTLLALGVIGFGFLHYRAAYRKSFDECQYTLNLFDFHYKTEPANYKVVMLGDSFMRIVSWDSLMNRTDVVSRGISGDRVHCICQRVVYLKDSPAKIVFVEGGTNDLPGLTADGIFAYYKQMTAFLQKQNKIVVINAVLYLSPKAGNKYAARKDYQAINKTIQALNIKLKAYAEEKNLDYIDLNKDLSDEGKLVLNDQYTQDGLHPNAAGFRIWAKRIEGVLSKHAI